MTITERIDAITGIPPEYLHAELPAPKSVKIELSPRCNYRCGFCALRTRDEQPKVDMDLDFFKRITTEMRDAGVEELGMFYLGESFMNPVLLEDAIRFTKEELEMPYVFLTSNASLANSQSVEAVMDAGLDSLKWSVNAADEEQFAEIMCVSKRWFGRAMNNIKSAHEIREAGGYKTRLYSSSIQYDGEQQEKMERVLNESVRPYVDEHYFLPLYGMSLSSKEIEDRIGYKPNHGNIGRIGALREPVPCWSVFTEGHIRADGHFSACCFGSDNRFDVGDLTTQTFMEAWNSPDFQSIRQAHLDFKTKGMDSLNGTICEVCVWS